MPIRLEGLDPAEKVHIAVKHDTTWAMAAAALKQKAGNPTWPLVIRKADGSYVAARYQTILDAGDVPPETPAENLPGLTAVEVVEMNEIGTGAAKDMVNASKTKILVVTNEGKFAGAMNQGAHRGEGLPSAKLDQLAGSNVDLSKLGNFLLDED